MYVFDTSPLSTLFRNYYRKRFPSLWASFDGLVVDGHIELLPVLWTPSLGGIMEPEVDHGTEEVHAGVQA